MDADALVAWAAEAPSLLVATDFDGTISDIAAEPSRARALPGALDALAKLARCPRTFVAVVSGRSPSSLFAETRIPNITRISEHGAFVAFPEDSSSEVAARGLSESDRAAVADLAARAESLLASSGAVVERKETAVAVHVRNVPSDESPRVGPKLAAWSLYAERRGFRLLIGKKVVEARRSSRDKGEALAHVLASLPRRTRLLYAGDDATDESALALCERVGGLGVFVRSRERPRCEARPALVVDSPKRWVAILRAIADAREDRAARATSTGS